MPIDFNDLTWGDVAKILAGISSFLAVIIGLIIQKRNQKFNRYGGILRQAISIDDRLLKYINEFRSAFKLGYFSEINTTNIVGDMDSISEDLKKIELEAKYLDHRDREKVNLFTVCSRSLIIYMGNINREQFEDEQIAIRNEVPTLTFDSWLYPYIETKEELLNYLSDQIESYSDSFDRKLTKFILSIKNYFNKSLPPRKK